MDYAGMGGIDSANRCPSLRQCHVQVSEPVTETRQKASRCLKVEGGGGSWRVRYLPRHKVWTGFNAFKERVGGEVLISCMVVAV